MGIYGEQVLPRIVNKACGMKAANPLRSRVCEGLHGQVVELGLIGVLGRRRGTDARKLLAGQDREPCGRRDVPRCRPAA